MGRRRRSEEHTSELQSRSDLVCRLLLEKKKNTGSVSSPEQKKHPSATGPSCRPAGWLSPGSRAWRCVHPPVRVLVASRRVFFFNDTATTEIYTLSLHDALPI